MKHVDYFRWWVTAPGRKRPYRTSFHMNAAEAADRYPGATPDLATKQEREVPESDAEIRAAMYNYQSAGHDSVQPPKKSPPST